jgi:hypothetical protein
MVPNCNNLQQTVRVRDSDQQVPSLELDGEILERIVEGCEDQECCNYGSSDQGCNSKGRENVRLQFSQLNPLASSTMIEACPCHSIHPNPGCTSSSVFTWTIHESDDDFLLEDSYMKDIDLCMFEDEAIRYEPKAFQRTSTKKDLSLVNGKEVLSNSRSGKRSKEKKCHRKKPIIILKNILRMKKSKDAS